MKSSRLGALVLCTTAVMTGQHTFGDVRYEGGSLPISQHGKLSISLDSSVIQFAQDRERLEIRTSWITGIFYGSKVHERFRKGVAIGALAVNPVAGVATLLLRKRTTRYIVLTWSESDKSKEGGAILKIAKDDHYQRLLAALSATTGKQAVNTDAAEGGK